tara:strand:- start:497 stop:820 length:324 start_codon:yes stop_codon:yes gene_type:complete
MMESLSILSKIGSNPPPQTDDILLDLSRWVFLEDDSMDYSDLVTIALSITALLLFRQLVLMSRRNPEESLEGDYTGKALDPHALARVDAESMREFDILLDNSFLEEE